MGRTDRARRRRFRVNRTRAIMALIIALVVGMFALSVKNIIDLHQERAQLKTERKVLANQKEDLETELKHINEDNYIEEQARTQLNMVMPGEKLYIVSGSEDE